MNAYFKTTWIPAFAGMTEKTGMTQKMGMTFLLFVGMTQKRRIPFLLFVGMVFLFSGSKVFADTVFFQNGEVLHGRITDANTELLSMRVGNPWWGNVKTIRRLALQSRQDLVETRQGKILTGEIIYMDGLHLEIRTSTGSEWVNRLWIKNMDVGIK